jgi:transcriptional regulator with XRE-family HTH domain
MLELTKRINDSGLSRFKVALFAGISPTRIEAIERGDRYHYSEIDRLGKYFGINGQELVKEVEVDGLERFEGKTSGTVYSRRN